MRQALASLVLATSILAHGYARARHGLHHVFGGVLVLLIALVVLPIAVVKRLGRKMRTEPQGNGDA